MIEFKLVISAMQYDCRIQFLQNVLCNFTYIG